jgi:tRNA (cmo5U34)-methyltransferase
MTDLFEDKAHDWDRRPVPIQISEGVGAALRARVALDPSLRVMDFGAGTGLVCAQVAPHVAQVYAVDISAAMLAQLAAKPELAGKVEIRQQDLLATPLGEPIDLIVSAMGDAPRRRHRRAGPGLRRAPGSGRSDRPG